MTKTKTIVTHVNPDLDAICAVWLLIKFGGDDFKESKVQFVPAGERLQEEDNNTVHVDTGYGKFDHHQKERGKENTCAAKLVYEWLVSEGRIKEDESLFRIVRLVTDIDHFREYFWNNADDDKYLMMLDQVLNGMKHGGVVKNDEELLMAGMNCLDGLKVAFKIRIKAERDIKQAVSFDTKWGKALAAETANSGVMKLALKKGYKLVVRRDPDIGSIRVKAAPLKNINLKILYERLKDKDSKATWFFHASGKMILNGSISNPNMVPSKLGLAEVIKIIKGL